MKGGRVVVAAAIGALGVPAVAACDGLIGLGTPTVRGRDAGVHDGSAEADAVADANHDADAADGDASEVGKDAGGAVSVLIVDAGAGLLAIDDAALYWADPNQGAIERCPLTGCASGPTTIYAQPGYNVGSGWGLGGLALQGQNVFLVLNQGPQGSLTECTASMPCTNPVTLDQNAPQIVGVTTSANNVFFERMSGLYSDGAPGTLVQGNVAARPAGLVVAGGSVYFATDDATQPVGWCSVNGCGTLPSYFPSAGQSQVAVSLAANSTTVFWTVQASSAVVASVMGGTAASVFATSSFPMAESIAADDVSVVFGSSAAGGSLETCPAPGCEAGGPTVLAGNLGTVGAIVMNATRVYAIVSGGSVGNTIVAVAR